MKRVYAAILFILAGIFQTASVYAWPTPVLTSPANGAQTWTGISLDWSAVNNSQRYQLELDTTPSFNSPVFFTVTKNYINSNSANTDTEHFAEDLFFGQVYYWRVRAYISGDTSAWGQRTFTTRDFVTLNSPATGSSSWAGVNLDWLSHTGVDFYDMEADTVDTFNSTAYKSASKAYINSNSANADTYHFLDDIFFGVTYYWRVRARNAVDTSSWSTIRTVDIRDYVTLVAPANGQINVNSGGTTLNWDAHVGIDIYQLQLDSTPLFNSAGLLTFNKAYINTNNNNSDTQQASGALAANTVYYWRVRVINAVDTSSWTTWSFSTTNCANPGAISGKNAVCQFSTTDYFVAPVTGATSYNWSLPSGWTGTSTTNTITATANNTGGIISVTVNNPCGTSMAQNLTVTVDSLLGFAGGLNGPSVACEGTLVSYFIPSVQGATGYIWTTPSGWTGSTTTNNLLVTVGSISGTISVVATNACDTSSALSVSTTVDNVPSQPGAITGNIDVCSGSPNTYSISPVSGATHYNWTFPAGWQGSSFNFNINAIAGPTSGIISVTALNACGASTPETINVNVSVIDTSVNVNSITLTSNEVGASYQWLDCDNAFMPITNATSQSFTPSVNGNYAVAILNNGCADTSACISVISVGLNENILAQNILVYPNPTGGSFNIDLSGYSGEATIFITDIHGKAVMNTTVNNEGIYRVNLNVLPGIYFIRVITLDGIRSSRITIQ